MRRLAKRTGRSHGSDHLLVEGPAAVREAAAHLTELFVTQGAFARHGGAVARARSAGAAVHVVADEILASVADTVTPQGMLGVATLPRHDLDEILATASLVVVLHDIRDPGNAGTAIRTADAAGADAVVFTAGSVDPRGSKAVRSSAGSLFHLPVVTGVPVADVLTACRRHGLTAVATAAGATASVTQTDLARRAAVLFGNEAHGLPREVVDACDTAVRVPMRQTPRPGFNGVAESLNLAVTVAVVVFEAARQRDAGDASSASDVQKR